MRFCTSCGRPVQTTAPFCTHCGARLNPSGQPVQGPSPASAAGGGSSLAKVVLIAGGVVVLLGVLLVGGLVYAGYRIKHKAQQVASELGVSGHPSTGPAARRTADVCSLLSREEAAQIAGVAVERLEREEGGCRYYGNPTEVASKGEAEAGEALAKLRSGQDVSPEEFARQAEQFAKGLGAQSAHKSGGLLLVIRVQWGDAASAEATYRITMKALTAGLPPGPGYGGKLEGVGDRAYLAPMGVALYMVKGDSWVTVEGPGLSSQDALIAVARKVAGRL